ncbi:MAG: ion channel [Ferruginibacter sp.]
MALLRKINARAKAEANTGFGVNASDNAGRFLNKDGSPNIEKRGVNLFERVSWFHTMLQLPRWKFFGIIFLFYIIINFIFASIYYIIGLQYLSGVNAASALGKFTEAYFFSAQTFTTVGYGRISPNGFIASAVASFEALIGLLSFALATGLLYGRFSKPKAYLRFSDNALLAPYKDGIAIMIRVAPYKNNYLTDAEATITVGMAVEDEGKLVNKFFTLALEFHKVNALSLSWTLVHPIDENSPFYKFSLEDFINTQGEMLVYVKAFDDMFSNTVVARSSYTFKEIIAGAKFVMMYHRNESNNKTVLDINKLSTYTPADISHFFAEDKHIVNG